MITAKFDHDAKRKSVANTTDLLERLLSTGYDGMVLESDKTYEAIESAIGSHASIKPDELRWMLGIVFDGIKDATQRADWRLGYGKTRNDATIPEVAMHLSVAAIDMLADPFNDKGIRTYRNRSGDFIKAMAEFCEEANGGIAGNMDFYGKLGRQVAQAVLDHKLAAPRPALVPAHHDYEGITEAAMTQLVYFIRAGDEGPIKIGIARDPAARLATLQTGHHETLVIVAIAAGGAAQEASYHALFSAHRVRGEWFAPHPDILAEIDRLNDGASHG